MRHPSIEWLMPAGAMLAAVTVSVPVRAVQYLDLAQAQKALYPAATEFRPLPVVLTGAQRESIEQAAGAKVRSAELRVWEARDASGTVGHFFVDEVTGKHEFITYAVAISPTGRVSGIEVMDYREAYGGQIRDERWRGQFAGKSAADPLKIDQDIRNISGATLSCSHVTDGVRRLLATWEATLKGAG